MKWTDHALRVLIERQIDRKLVEDALKTPDEIVGGKFGRRVYHKLVGRKLLRVIVEGDVVITVYMTDKIHKYWKGGKA